MELESPIRYIYSYLMIYLLLISKVLTYKIICLIDAKVYALIFL